MKHQVELRLPKLFGKKKVEGEEETPEVVTKVYIDDEVKEIPLPVLLVVTLAVGVTAGYFIGFRQGVHKGGSTYIFND